MNIVYLKEALVKNSSIQTLDLQKNELGSNNMNFVYLKEALIKNNSIQESTIYENDLSWSNENYLKDIIKRKNNNSACNLF